MDLIDELKKKIIDELKSNKKLDKEAVLFTAKMLGVHTMLLTPNEDTNFTIRDEANAIVAYAFRNGYLENLHTNLSGFNNPKMKKLMIESCEKMNRFLIMKKYKPAKYDEIIRDYNLRFCRTWNRD